MSIILSSEQKRKADTIFARLHRDAMSTTMPPNETKPGPTLLKPTKTLFDMSRDEAPHPTLTPVTPSHVGQKSAPGNMYRAAKSAAIVATAEALYFKSGQALTLGALSGAYSYASDYAVQYYGKTLISPQVDESLIAGALGIVGTRYVSPRPALMAFLEFAGADYLSRMA
jgi:hypothetical protein